MADVNAVAEHAAKHRAVLPINLRTVDGRTVTINRINDTTIRVGTYLFDVPTALDVSIALGRAVSTEAHHG